MPRHYFDLDVARGEGVHFEFVNRSADGFTQTYAITTDTRQGRQPVHAGEAATIRAVERNGTNTATAISPVR